MKRKILYISLLLLCLFCNQTKATHVVGAEIYYKNLGSDTIEITTVIYRRCTDGAASISPGALTFTSDSCANAYSGTITNPFSHTYSDVTPVCPDSSGPCGTSNTASSSMMPAGIEKHIYKYKYFFGGTLSNCCWYKLKWELCCRNSNISTGFADANFITYTWFNRCLSTGDESPIFRTEPHAFLCYGFTRILDQGAIDSNGDSLTYKLVLPAGGGSYSSPWSFTYPLTCWGGNNINPNANPPTGFYLNPVTGYLTFRPMQVSATVFKVEVTEWRTISGVKKVVGKISRDIQYFVIAGCSITTPSQPGLDSFETCANHKICVPLNSNTTNSVDTVRISLIFNGIDSTVIFTNNNDSVRLASGMLCWTPPTSAVSGLAYFFTVSATAAHCVIGNRLLVSTSKQYRIKVRAEVTSTYKKRKLNCRDYDFVGKIDTTTANSNPKSIRWYINNVQVNGSTKIYPGDSLRYRFRRFGIYNIRMEMVAGGSCTEIKYDTIQVDTLNFVNFSLSNDTTICESDSALIKVTSISNGTAPFKYKWFANNLLVDTNSSFKVSPNIPTWYRCELTTSDSCTDFAIDSVLIYTTPHHIPISDYSVCRYDSVYIQCADTASINSYTWYYLGNTVSTQKNIYAKDTGNYIVKVLANGCTLHDTIKVTYIALPLHNPLNDTNVCYPNGTITLNTQNNFTNYSYTWYRSDTVFSTIKNPIISDTGIIVVKIKNNTSGCTRFDTLTIGRKPFLTIPSPLTNKLICTNDSVLLTINDTSTSNTYTWRRNGTVFSTQKNIYAKLAGIYSITLTSIWGCSSTSTDTVTLYPLPTHTKYTNRAVCVGDSSLVQNNDSTSYSYEWYYNGNFLTSNKSIYLKNAGLYKQKITNSFGCVLWDSVLLTLNPYPIHNDIGNITICHGDTAFMQNTDTATYNYQWYKWIYGLGWSVWATAKSLKVVDSGMYAVNIYTTAGCAIFDSVKVSKYPSINHNKISNKQYCYPDSAYLTNTDTSTTDTYIWYYGGNIISTAKSIVVLDTGKYIQRIQNIYGCVKYDTMRVDAKKRIYHTPFSDYTICNGETLHIINNDTCVYTSQWQRNGSFFSTSKNVDITLPGLYVLAMTNNVGCTLLDSITVTVLPSPSHTKISNKTICSIDSAYLQNIDSAQYTFEWSLNGNVISNQPSIYVKNPGLYFQKITRSNGCFVKDSVLVVVNITPTHTNLPDKFVCIGDSILTQNIDSVQYAFKWFKNGSQISTFRNIYLKSAGNYVLEITNIGGCKKLDTFIVTMQVPPTHIKLNNQTFCSGDSVLIQNNDSAHYSFVWTFKGNIISTQQSIYAKKGGIYYQQIIQPNGCIVKDSVTVIELITPTHTPLADMYICTGDSVITQNTDSSQYYFAWYFNGAYLGNQKNIIVKTPGKYVVRISGGSVCLVYDTFELFLTNKPYHITIPDIDFCNTDSAYLSNNYVSNNVYQWYYGGNLISTQKNIYTQIPGEYVVRVESPAGCIMFDTLEVNKRNLPVHFKIYNQEMCPQDSVQVHNIDSTTYSVSWIYNGTEISTQKSVYLKKAGTYINKVTNSFGCSIFDTFVVSLSNIYPIHTAIKDESYCENDSVWLYNVDSATYNYTWYYGGNIISTSRNIYAKNPGEYIVRVGHWGPCVIYDTVMVFQYPKPVFSVTPLNPTIIKGNSITIKASVPNYSYGWLGNNIISSGGDSAVLKPTTNSTYTVIARTSDLCKDSITFLVTVDATGVKDYNVNTKIKIFPNPANNLLKLNKEFTEGCVITITDNIGKVLLIKHWSDLNTSIDISEYSEGIYTLTISNADIMEYYKFMKVKE